jgi:hypothetical protein
VKILKIIIINIICTRDNIPISTNILDRDSLKIIFHMT